MESQIETKGVEHFVQWVDYNFSETFFLQINGNIFLHKIKSIGESKEVPS